jgi:hypothetical protein
LNCIYLGIQNYYGMAHSFELDGKYYICIDDANYRSSIEISEKFYNAIVEEFKDKQEKFRN